MIVGKTIKLNANIDVTGKGFLGGGTVTGQGLCVNSNSTRFDKYSFHRDSTNSGLKGKPCFKGWLIFNVSYQSSPHIPRERVQILPVEVEVVVIFQVEEAERITVWVVRAAVKIVLVFSKCSCFWWSRRKIC